MSKTAIHELELSRYVVGIDLGTTNCSVAYVDTESTGERQIVNFPLEQVISNNLIESRLTLPSFIAPLDETTLLLPWEDRVRGESRPVAGIYAREFGMRNPSAFVSSAKSWLCHSKVDRLSAILPWTTGDDSDSDSQSSDKTSPTGKSGRKKRFKWSPVEASAFYLEHIRLAWNYHFPDSPLEEQDVIITLPASFDEIARELTIEAAKKAGLPNIILIEEPLAAFYCWMENHRELREEIVAPGGKILVCDVGGGTTDFTLLRVLKLDDSDSENQNENDGDGKADPESFVRFHRIAVGDHLILGGDNFDLALAGYLEKRLFDEKRVPEQAENHLPTRTWNSLIRLSCRIKEDFLAPGSQLQSAPYQVPGTGARLIGGGIPLEVTRREIEEVVVDGFFPKVPLDAKPERRRSGFREMGLPFASDPAVTRHLARFLTVHRHTGENLMTGTNNINSSERSAGQQETNDPARPDCILFNGGAFISPILRERLCEVVGTWFSNAEHSWRPVLLENEEPELAVSRGAAWYGIVLRGEGRRISASLARTYYIGVQMAGTQPTDSLVTDSLVTDSQPAEEKQIAKSNENKPMMRALCLVPASVEPGTEIPLTGRLFELTVGKPVQFPIFVSSVRLTDRPGELVPVNPEEMKALPPIQTVLKTRSAAKISAGTIAAELKGRLTELGTIELFLAESQRDSQPKVRKRNWKLQFDVRTATQTDIEPEETTADREGVLDESLVSSVEQLLESVFGTETKRDDPVLCPVKPSEMVRKIEEVCGMSRHDYPPTLLRRMADALLRWDSGRAKSASHETRWLNLLGFCCRPGFGASMDDWRMEQIWKRLIGTLIHRTAECRTQNWILWRRLASGLTLGRQQTLVEPLLSNIASLHRQTVDGRGKGPDLDFTSQEGAEIWRLIGAMELLPVTLKEELGQKILQLMDKRRMASVREAMFWTIGRMGARSLFHAPLNAILAVNITVPWIRQFLESGWNSPNALFALACLARKTGDRYFDIDSVLRGKVLDFLSANNASAAYIEMVTNPVSAGKESGKEREISSAIFGESLPLGLNLK